MGKGDKQQPGHRLPRHPGRFYMRSGPSGAIAVGWPRKRPGPKTPNQLKNENALREFVTSYKYLDGDQVAQITRDTAKSSLLPRDWAAILWYGRGFTIGLEGGGVIYPMAVNLDFAFLLDSIAQTPGDLIVRGMPTWEALHLGNEGQILIVGPDNRPIWTDAPEERTGGFAGQTYVGQAYTNTTSARANNGLVITPRTPIVIEAICAAFNVPASPTKYAAAIYELTAASTSATVVAVTAPLSADVTVTSSPKIVRCPLTAPATLLAGVPYVLTVSRTDGTPTSAANNYFTQVGTGFAIPNAPVEALQALVGYNTLALTVGQAPSATGTGTWFIWPEGYEGL